MKSYYVVDTAARESERAKLSHLRQDLREATSIFGIKGMVHKFESSQSSIRSKCYRGCGRTIPVRLEPDFEIQQMTIFRSGSKEFFKRSRLIQSKCANFVVETDGVRQWSNISDYFRSTCVQIRQRLDFSSTN